MSDAIPPVTAGPTGGKPAREGPTGPCGPKVAVRLPVLGAHAPSRPMIKSKMGKWRALVLTLLYGVFLVHLAQWFVSGMSDGVRETVSPVEPSESMFTLETGQVNAGFVMFCAALLSTVIFGRFFCGWACHVVALQDWCGWMMKKAGVHPKPFRSRLLLWAPLCLAIYMFVWPTLRREVIVPMVAVDLNGDRQYSAYVTGQRESVFNRDLNGDGRVSLPGDPADLAAGVREAVVNRDLNADGDKDDVLTIASEYPAWLGDVVPLHGFTQHFIVENFWATFAPWYIALPFLFVCGFVTVYFMGAKAFCSYGCPYGGFFAPLDRVAPFRILVNDNCNQCGHCTAVCTSNVRVHEEVHDYGAVVDPGCMKCLDCVSVCPTDALRVGLGKPALAIKPRVDEETVAKHAAGAQRRWDLSIGEEVAIGAVFLLMFLGYRGMYQGVPLLMAMGVASVAAFGAWKLWRLFRDRNVRGPFVQLKRDGRWRVAGVLFALCAAATLAVGVQSFVMNMAAHRAELIDYQITTPYTAVFSPEYKPAEDEKARAERAIRLLTLAGPITRGGIGFGSTAIQDVRLAWLHSVAGDRVAGEAALMRSLRNQEPGVSTLPGLMQFFRLRKAPPDEVERVLTEISERWPDSDVARAQLAAFFLNTGRPERATAVYDQRLKAEPGDVAAVNSAATIRSNLQRPAEAVALAEEGLKHRPKSPLLHERLAIALMESRGDPARAAEAMRFAAERQESVERWYMLSQIYGVMGKAAEADNAMLKARTLDEKLRKAAGIGAQGVGTGGSQPGSEPPSATK